MLRIIKQRRQIVRRYTKIARTLWRNMSRRARLISRRTLQPKKSGRDKYFQIEIESKKNFVLFRAHDFDKKGRVKRIMGKREDGSWGDYKWLISKQSARVKKGKLIPESNESKKLMEVFGLELSRMGEDKFKANPRKKFTHL